jgi:hypothetical protein
MRPCGESVAHPISHLSTSQVTMSFVINADTSDLDLLQFHQVGVHNQYQDRNQGVTPAQPLRHPGADISAGILSTSYQIHRLSKTPNATRLFFFYKMRILINASTKTRHYLHHALE